MPGAAEEAFDPVPILARLAAADLDFVVIGGVAGGAHGSAYATYDVDLAYARTPENLERLARVLRSLHATLSGAPANTPFQLDARSLEEDGNFTFTTDLGPIDVFAYPAGSPGYDRLRAGAAIYDIEGYEVRFASLDHLIAMKEATGRPRDKLAASEYRAIADELNPQKG